ncbi:death domain-containing protein CRADD isoform X3 [Hypanus sabinus]|uniref:death domain-containing protein CRADD isoform X3 n=1 Tax=Hypanus sabinus TaxID=79690 RepID=UPI0028C4D070|nr:death domain-containing protein CRADD isoform X3 [Hypanus sabinus]
MEPKQRRILRRLRLELADQLRVEQLVQYLYQERVVSQNFLEELEAEPVSVRRTLKLLDYLPGRGPRAFAAFIESLRDEFPWLCRRLEEEEERAEDEPEPPEAPLSRTDTKHISRRGAHLQQPVHHLPCQVYSPCRVLLAP